MTRTKKLALGLGVFLAVIGFAVHSQYLRLKNVYVRSVVQNDYSALEQAVQLAGLGHVAVGSGYEMSPGKVEALLKVTLPNEQPARQKVLNSLGRLKPVSSFDPRYVSSSSVTFGSIEGDEYVYRWRVVF